MAKASSKSKLVAPEEEVEQSKEVVFESEPLKHETIELANGSTLLVGERPAVFADEPMLTGVPEKQKVELSKEEKIINFLESRGDGEFVINDFLKSLYPIPTYNMPAEYLRQGESKALKGLLTKMQAEGKIAFVDNSYQKLGQFYYEGGDTQTKHYNILNVKIVAKK